MRSEVLFAMLLTVAAVPASAATLTFDGDICNGGPCTNYSPIGQDYGDIAGQVDVSHNSALFWDSGYESLQNVAFTNIDNTLLMTFQALAGYGVALSGFDIASYADRLVSTRVVVTDLAANTVLFDSGSFEPETGCGNGGAHAGVDDVCSFAGNWSSSTGLQIAFGPDAWDAGIDNIGYSTFVLDEPAPVPLPASAWLLGAALAGIGGLKLRRQGRRL